jgi:hypothetical protein
MACPAVEGRHIHHMVEAAGMCSLFESNDKLANVLTGAGSQSWSTVDAVIGAANEPLLRRNCAGAANSSTKCTSVLTDG